MVEEYLAGQEGTVTVMPPSESKPSYWALPLVLRFNHENDIAPYNGVVAVTRNSRAVSQEDMETVEAFRDAAAECVKVAEVLRVTAPIRVDVRSYDVTDQPTRFALFDVNMKPVSTKWFCC